MNTVKVLKNTLPIVASVGAAAVVATVLKTFTPAEPKLITKIAFPVGVFVLTSIASDAAASYVDKEIDKTAQQVQDLNAAIDLAFPTKSEED